MANNSKTSKIMEKMVNVVIDSLDRGTITLSRHAMNKKITACEMLYDTNLTNFQKSVVIKNITNKMGKRE